MLLLADVDGDVLVLRTGADDHAFIDICAGSDEETTSLLSGEQAVGDGFAGLKGDQGTLMAGDDIALVGLVGIEDVVHDTVSVGVGEELGTVAHQAAGRDAELDMGGAAVAGAHVDQLRLAGAELLHHGADVCLRHLDHEVLDRLAEHAVDGFGDDLRAADLELIALAAHGLDQDGQVQLAAAADLEGVGGIGLLDAEGDVCLDLLEESVADVAGGDILALSAREGRVVDDEIHGNGWLVDLDEGQRIGSVDVADGLADIDIGDAGNADEVAHLGFLALDALEALELIELADLDTGGSTVLMAQNSLLAGLDATALDSADADPADVLVVLDIGDEELEGCFDVALRRGDLADDGFEQRLHVGGHLVVIERGDALARGGVDDRELKLIVVGAELDEEVEHLVDDLLRTRAVAVDLIDDDERLLAQSERLFQHETGLGHTALKGVDQKENAVHHHEDALDLAAEIGMSGGIDDIDLGVSVHDGGVLGQNGDTALALQIITIHDAVVDDLVGAENARLTEELVDQSGLAVVNVGNDRDIPEIFSF